MIRLDGLTLGRVLSDVSLHLPRGRCLGVVGLNGAGKSTLLGVLAGQLRPDCGSLAVDTPDFAYLPEGAPLEPHIRVRSWLRFGAGLPGWSAARASKLMQRFQLDPAARAAALSQGQRVQLGLVLTLARVCPLYLLDDPFLGLDPVARRLAEQSIAEVCEQATVVIAAQDSAALGRLCTDLALLVAGQLAWAAPLSSWLERYRRLLILPAGRPLARAPHELLGPLLIDARPQGHGQLVVVDDPTGQAERRLELAGVPFQPRPLPLDALLIALVRGQQPLHELPRQPSPPQRPRLRVVGG